MSRSPESFHRRPHKDGKYPAKSDIEQDDTSNPLEALDDLDRALLNSLENLSIEKDEQGNTYYSYDQNSTPAEGEAD